MRRPGLLAALITVVLGLGIPAVTQAADTVDPVVSAGLVLQGERISGFRGGDLDGDGHEDLVAVDTFQVTLGEFASDATIFFGPLPQPGATVEDAGIQGVPVST